MRNNVFLFLLAVFLSFSVDATLFAQGSSVKRDLEELGIFLNHQDQFFPIADLNIQSNSSLSRYTFLNRNKPEIWYLRLNKHPKLEKSRPKLTDDKQVGKHRGLTKGKLGRKELKQLGGNFGVLVDVTNSNIFDTITYNNSTYYPVTSLTVSGNKALINLTIYNISNRNQISRRQWIKQIKKFVTIDR